jgi:hypothetical protein
MVEGSRIPDICLLQCLYTHIEKTTTVVWKAMCHMDFCVRMHIDYGNWLFHLLEDPASLANKIKEWRKVGLPVNFLRNHFKKGLGRLSVGYSPCSHVRYEWRTLCVCVCVCVCVCARAGLNTLFNETFSLTAILLVVCVISGSTAKEITSVFFWVMQWVVAISY